MRNFCWSTAQNSWAPSRSRQFFARLTSAASVSHVRSSGLELAPIESIWLISFATCCRRVPSISWLCCVVLHIYAVRMRLSAQSLVVLRSCAVSTVVPQQHTYFASSYLDGAGHRLDAWSFVPRVQWQAQKHGDDEMTDMAINALCMLSSSISFAFPGMRDVCNACSWLDAFLA